MHITFIQTGGSIDKDYPRGKTHHGYEFVITDAAAKRVCEAFDFVFDYDVIEVLKKDSLDMTDDDCAAIVNAVREVSSDRIVITHGTDTIIQTGEALAAEITDKTIVLTGSALPEKFTNSDARFNIGMATGAAQVLPAGVYVALYGRVVPLEEFAAIDAAYAAKVEAVRKSL